MNLLKPKTNNLEITGKVSYHESVHAWNTIRFKKPVLDMFPQLRNKSSIIKFKLEFSGSYDELIRRIVELKEKKEGIPLLLYLLQE